MSKVRVSKDSSLNINIPKIYYILLVLITLLQVAFVYISYTHGARLQTLTNMICRIGEKTNAFGCCLECK